MKNTLINLARIGIILGSAFLVIEAASTSIKSIVMVFAGIFFKDYFTRGVYDPIFGEGTAQDWLMSALKRKREPKAPAHPSKRVDV